MKYKQIKSIIDKTVSLLLGEKCSHCGSRNTNRSFKYIRGYNKLCNQACGDDGIFCFNCNNITFDKKLEEYKATLPDWCTAYDK